MSQVLNLKELIEADFFPKDENGYALVPRRGYDDYDTGTPPVAIITTDAPGDHPLVGVGCTAAMSFNAYGEWQPGNMAGFSDAEIEANSLQMPEPVGVHVEKFMLLNVATGTFVDEAVYDTRQEAADCAADDEVVVRLSGFGIAYNDTTAPTGPLFDDADAVEQEPEERAGSVQTVGYAYPPLAWPFGPR